MAHVADKFDMSEATIRRHVARGQFPAPVFQIVPGRSVWLTADIRAFRDTGRVPTPRTDAESATLRATYLTPPEVADRLRVSPNTIRTWLAKRRHDKVPAPAGHFYWMAYWRRDDLEAFMADPPPPPPNRRRARFHERQPERDEHGRFSSR